MIKRAIYKYELRHEKQIIEMPMNAQIIHTDVQEHTICLWAEVNPEADYEERIFKLVPTGQNFDYSEVLYYHGTVLFNYGRLVYHIYELKN